MLTRFYYSDATGNDITFSDGKKSVAQLGIEALPKSLIIVKGKAARGKGDRKFCYRSRR